MKTKIAAALSVVGVLGAGSAAALVNTQILDSGPTDSGASAAVLPQPESIDLEVPTTTEQPEDQGLESSTTSSTTVPPAPAPTVLPAAAPAPAASGMLTEYNVGDAGTVTVDVIDGRLLLVSAEPKAGWTVTKAEDDSMDDSDDVEDEIEVEFTSATVRVEFEAHLVDGQIVPKVESRSIGGTTSAPRTTTANSVPSNTIDDDDHDEFEDDDHDEYEDDDHEDDHDEYEDDDHEDERDDD